MKCAFVLREGKNYLSGCKRMKIIAPVSLFSATKQSATRGVILREEDSVSQQPVSSSASYSSSSESRATTSKFHRAALDGYIDMLCDASRRDTNFASQLDGFTPTLLAAHSGQLEALRILVGRGGEPERTTTNGSSGLHLAAARGHLNCVSFLVNFGVNMWALDNDLHTAKDVAAMEQRKEVLDYLDQMMAKQSALNTKNVQKLKEKAKLSAEKRLKQVRKAQLKAIKQIERDERYLARLSNNRRLLKSAHSIGDIRLVCRSSSSQSPSINGSDVSSFVSSSPIGSLLAAANRRSSIDGQSAVMKVDANSSTSSSTNKRYFGRANSRDLPTIITTAKQSLSSNRSAILDGHSRASNSIQSSLSSASSSLSAFLPQLTCDRQLKSVRQFGTTKPKYSELVAISKSDAAQRLKKNSPAITETNNNNSTSLGSKLTKGLGGVSRKVHLRKFLQIASSTSDLSNGNTRTSSDANPGLHSGELPRDKDSSSIRWPPAPALSRALSEPDFGQITEEPCANPEAGNNCSNGQCRSDSGESHPSKSRDNAIRDDSQHKLLTQCLTQLKLRHEQACSSANKRYDLKQTGTSDAQMGLTDELLLDQRLIGGANDRLIKPSVIKQKLLRKASIDHMIPVAPSGAGVDSIGSAGSLADPNTPRSSNSIVTSASSSTFSSASCSYTASSCKDLLEPPTTDNRSATDRKNLESAETMDTFLEASGLLDLGEVFSRERIDLEALMLLTEDDMKSLNILLGPRRKLLKAVEDRRLHLKTATNALGYNLDNARDSAKYVMVDTPL